MTNRRHRWAVPICLLLVIIPSCASSGPRGEGDALDARGVFVRHLRIRTVPEHTSTFEGILRDAVMAARARGESGEWLCYRETPGRYWLIFTSDTAHGFTYPPTLRGFVRHLDRSLADRLEAMAHEVEWNMLTRMKRLWSTVDGMDTATHPKARLMMRWVKPGRAADFDRAIVARTAFLAEHDYPLPVEGFVTLAPEADRHFQVVFPRDWVSFHGTESFGAFIGGLDEEAKAGYARVKQALMVTMSRAEFHHGDHAPELGYRRD